MEDFSDTVETHLELLRDKKESIDTEINRLKKDQAKVDNIIEYFEMIEDPEEYLYDEDKDFDDDDDLSEEVKERLAELEEMDDEDLVDEDPEESPPRLLRMVSLHEALDSKCDVWALNVSESNLNLDMYDSSQMNSCVSSCQPAKWLRIPIGDNLVKLLTASDEKDVALVKNNMNALMKSQGSLSLFIDILEEREKNGPLNEANLIGAAKKAQSQFSNIGSPGNGKFTLFSFFQVLSRDFVVVSTMDRLEKKLEESSKFERVNVGLDGNAWRLIDEEVQFGQYRV